MVEAKPTEKEPKKEVLKKRHDSTSSSSSDSSSGTSDSSSFSDSSSSSRSGTTTSTESSRSPTPKKTTKDRARSPGRRSRSPRGVARADRGEKAVIASSRRSPTPERHRRRSSPSPKRRPSPSPKRRDRSGSRDRRNRSRSRERKPSPVRKATPPPRRLCVRNLSRNVTKEHLSEIFSVYGSLKSCELPMDRQHTHLGRGYGYVEFEQPEDAEKALKHMDGGQIDGQEITCELTHPPRSAVNGGGRRPLSPIRYRGASPRRYRSPPRGRGTGGNMMPLGPSRFNRSRSRSPRRRRSRS